MDFRSAERDVPSDSTSERRGKIGFVRFRTEPLAALCNAHKLRHCVLEVGVLSKRADASSLSTCAAWGYLDRGFGANLAASAPLNE